MTLFCTVTVYRILKIDYNSMCHLPWDHYITIQGESFVAVYNFHYLCPVLSVRPDNIRHHTNHLLLIGHPDYQKVKG